MHSGGTAVIGSHYRVGKKIGEGSFGVVFEGTNLLNGNAVAIKFVSLVRSLWVEVCLLFDVCRCDHQEPRKADAPQLRDEYRSYRALNGTREFKQLVVMVELIVSEYSWGTSGVSLRTGRIA